MKLFTWRVGIMAAALVAAIIFSYPFWTTNFSRDHQKVIRQKVQEALRRCATDQQLHFIINGVDVYSSAMDVSEFTPADEQELEKDICRSNIHVIELSFQRPTH